MTNAYTESLNDLIRLMNRLGRGYSFEALRAKKLFTEGLHKRKLARSKFERRRDLERFEMAVPFQNEPFDPRDEANRPCNYGADIPTLIELLEHDTL